MISKFSQYMFKHINQSNHSIGIWCDNKQFNYADIYKITELWAGHIRGTILQQGDSLPEVIPVIAQRNEKFLFAVIACWKLGIGVIPISGDTPDNRIKHIISESDSKYYLNTLQMDYPLSGTEIRLAKFSTLVSYEQYKASSLAGIAYVIYTSGTTGKPKGCVIGEEAIVPIIESVMEHFGFGEHSRVTFSANIAFDAAMFEILPALFSGSAIYILSEGTVHNPVALCDFYSEHQVTFSWLATPVAEALIAFDDLILPECLQTIVTAGQRLTKRPPKHWQCQLVNAYGPTETSIIATCGNVADSGGDLPDVGSEISGVQCYVVDENLKLVPDGEIGELLITGNGVGRGYLNNPDQTKLCFIQFQHGENPPQKAYRTGDLFRVNARGLYKFTGRLDNQIKINGYRIEIGEVVQTLLSVPGVLQSHVMKYEKQSGKLLIGYVCISDQENYLSESAILSHCRQSLPEYMLPSFIVFLDSFPLTANQKFDEEKLPLPAQLAKVSATSDFELDEHQQPFLQVFRDVMEVCIDWEDDFFLFGGNSVTSLLISAAMYKLLSKSINFELFTTLRTPSKIYQQLIGQETHYFEITRQSEAPKQDNIFPLSSSQRSIWFLANADTQNRAYHAKSIVEFEGDLNAEAVAYSLKKIVEKHSIFRTVFLPGNGEGLQQVFDHFEVQLEQFDYSGEPHQVAREKLDHLVKENLNQPFDLSRLPLVRWGLVKLPESRQVLIHIEHHLVHDGWSYNLFLEDFKLFYTDYVQGSEQTESSAFQYTDYCVAQSNWLAENSDVEEHLDYWSAQLNDASTTISLPNYLQDIPVVSKGKTIRKIMSREKWQAIKKLAVSRGETEFSILYCAYLIMLHKFSGDTDINVGSAFANRHWVNAESIIGMMINTVVLRMQVERNSDLATLLTHCFDVVSGTQKYQALPFEYLVQKLNPKRTAGSNPWFQVFFGFHDSKMPEINLPGVNHSGVMEAIDSQSFKFDLSVVIIPREKQQGENDPVHVLWEFNLARYPEWLIENMSASFDTIVDTILDNSLCKISNIPIVGSSVIGEQLAVQFTGIYDSISRFAKQNPTSIAMTCSNESITYAQLKTKVEQHACYLISQGVGQGDLIGICLPRSITCVAWMISAQVLGAGYIPIDPEYPEKRVEYIISHSKIKTLVTEMSREDVHCIPPASIDTDEFEPSFVNPNSTMYVIYTSGSSGVPKGVSISYAAFYNFMVSMRETIPLSNDSKWLAITSISFDISTLELYLPLICGAQVVLMDNEQAADAAELTQQFSNNHISHCQTTPSAWKNILNAGFTPSESMVLLSGGEAMDQELAKVLTSNGARCFNMYGPTEATVWCSMNEVDSFSDVITIGTPLHNTQIRILDSSLQPIPVGGVGDLWISGACLAENYLHQENLTRQKFVINPSTGERMYSSGDRASLGSDGKLYFWGRSDQQVKLNGFRIELEEIEKVIRQLSSVQETAAVVRNSNGYQSIVAFISGTATTTEVIEQCKKYLPNYSVPARVIILEQLPKTPNLKINREALADIQVETEVVEVANSQTEKDLAADLSKLLNRDQVDVLTHFYELGGNSLVAMHFSRIIEGKFSLSIKAVELIDLGTVRNISAYIDSILYKDDVKNFVEELMI